MDGPYFIQHINTGMILCDIRPYPQPQWHDANEDELGRDGRKRFRFDSVADARAFIARIQVNYPGSYDDVRVVSRIPPVPERFIEAP